MQKTKAMDINLEDAISENSELTESNESFPKTNPLPNLLSADALQSRRSVLPSCRSVVSPSTMEEPNFLKDIKNS